MPLTGQSETASREPKVRWCSPRPAKKHVVFLGAGASKSSGYPLANELTLLMCDLKAFEHALDELFSYNVNDHAAEQRVIKKYHKLNEAAQILRGGDFATMDELSKSAAGGAHRDKILDLKKLMRLVLCLNNADIDHFSSSDYRRFIQKLFPNGELREDVSIISFNYDPYLEFRLFRAFTRRQQVRPFKQDEIPALSNAINSGLTDPKDLAWISREGFCHLKLHGTAVQPLRQFNEQLRLPPKDGAVLTADYVFGFGAAPLLAHLCKPPFSTQDPPALLPWEIVHEEGRLLTEQEFTDVVGENWQHKNSYPLFMALWAKAREEVGHADKISLVGLSLNAFMEPEMRFLFGDKRGDVQFVIANPENERFKDYENQLHPNSLAGRTFELFTKRIGASFKFQGSFSEYDTGFDEGIFDTGYEPTITCHASFRDFIEAEM